MKEALTPYDPEYWGNARQYTILLHQMMQEKRVAKDTVIECCLAYMSEDDVEDMMKINELLETNGHDQ